MTQELHVPVTEGQLFVTRQGAGEPVLLVHGIFASGYCWRHVAAALAEEYEVYTVDLLGFGRSDMPPTADYGQSMQARRLHELIARLGLSQVRLVGHSMGGEIAVHAALQDSDPFCQLVLVSADGFRPAFTGWQRMLLSGRWMNWFVRKMFDEKGLQLSASRVVLDPGVFRGEVIDGYVSPYRRQEFPLAVRQVVRTREGGMNPEWLSGLSLPTLLLWGEQDRIVPTRIGDAYQERMPHAVYHRCEGCGHMPMEEQPEWLVAELRAFFQTKNRKC